MRFTLCGLPVVGFNAACSSSRHPLDQFEVIDATTVVEAPVPRPSSVYDAKAVAQGQYLVQLLGCGACHTDGALIGEPNPERLLAGSRIGLAHSNPLLVKRPGVVFAPNLTPDPDTGIGRVTDSMVMASIKGNANRHGLDPLKVMPTSALTLLRDDDLHAIVAYLRSLEPIHHQVPDRVLEGQSTDEKFVHFGVYQSRR